MAVELGDIVFLSEMSASSSQRIKWVVAGFVNNPSGRIEAKLVRKNQYGTYSCYHRNPDVLVPVERPIFTPGDIVTVDGNRGTFMCRDRREGGLAMVMLAPRRRAFTGVGFIEIKPATATMSYPLFVIENRKP